MCLNLKQLKEIFATTLQNVTCVKLYCFDWLAQKYFKIKHFQTTAQKTTMTEDPKCA